MKVTVCELSNDPDQLRRDWDALTGHVAMSESDLVLLPEMPFYPWIAWTNAVDAAAWQAAVDAHRQWIDRFSELSGAAVLGTQPVVRNGHRYNECFVWEPETGYRPVHLKYYLPDEDAFWEATWYERGDGDFSIAQVRDAKIGFLACTEMWFSERARDYGKLGAHLILSPRATPDSSVEKWVAGGRVAAVVSGAYCVSSNRGGVDAQGIAWAGTGWIIEPEEGDVLATTSTVWPYVTLDIDLSIADAAKQTYPRYVRE